jgi:PPP family 3-phenylpropionic acid transporter
VQPASLAPFGAVAFTYFAAIGVFNVYAPLWFESLGFSTIAIGAIASMQAWTRVLVPYAWSWAGDHWEHGARRASLMCIAAAALLAMSLVLMGVRSYAAVTVVVVLAFVANGAIVPLNEAALAQRLATAKGLDVGRYGRVRVWGSIGFIVSVAASGALLQHTGIAALPSLYVLSSVALLAAAWSVPHEGRASSAAGDGAVTAGVGTVLRRPAVAWFFAGTFLTVLAHSPLYVFFSLYLVSLGHGKTAVGLLWAASVAAEIVFFWTQGRWFARWNAHAWLVAGAAAAALRFAAVAAFGGQVLLLALTQLLHAVSFAAQHAACIAMVDRHFAGALRGRGQALYTVLGYGASGVLGGVAGGAISERFGYPALFATAAAVALGAMGCYARSRALDRLAPPAGRGAA